MAARARALVHPRLDGWLLGGLGVVAWLVVSRGGASIGPITGILSGVFITLAAMHFGASYHLAYGDGLRSLKRHPVGLVLFPAALAAASAFVVLSQTSGHGATGRAALRLLLVAVFTLTGWHYIKQAYGIAMLSARSAGLRPTRREAFVLRYALYPVWLYDVLEIYGRGRSATYQAYDVTVSIIPPGLDPWIRGGAALSLVAALGLMAVLGARAGRVPPLGLWGTYLAGGLWFLVPPTYVSATVVLAGLHAVQYLTVSHRAEVDLAVERREPHLVHRWLCVFGGAAAGGLLLTNWLPDLAVGSASPGVPAMIPSLVFVVFNLHHYAVDAVIWRSGGEHVVRMGRGPHPIPAGGAAPGTPAVVHPSPALV